ncbi:Serine-threonine/tyrosine-protein kinase, catalytic domain [Sesbania bispinosa]|nr:Serine-threonine/tyrosine-protein kinase, catalytic domain [Sesbania bispinosa]
MSIKCEDNAVSELKIMGDKSVRASWFNGFAVPNQTLSVNFSIDSFFTTLTKLTSLRVLSLVSLGLWGPLPDKVHLFSLLEVLDLSSNFLFGAIPPKISTMPQQRGSYCKESNSGWMKFKAWKVAVAVAIIFGLVIVILVSGVFLCKRYHLRKTTRQDVLLKIVQDNSTTGVSSEILANARFISQTVKLGAQTTPICRQFSVEELKEATRNFDLSTYIGEGSIGKLYKGKLENGSYVVIRSLALSKKCSIQNLKARLDLLSKLQHPNLVSLLGHCIDVGGQDDSSNHKLHLIYEYVPNGNYHTHLSEFSTEKALKWSDRLTILIGVAKAVHFLHTGVIPGCFNNQLRTNNILLDEHRIPKLSDYGMSIITEEIEKFEAKGEKPKSCQKTKMDNDVYNFGFILFESLVGPIACDKEWKNGDSASGSTNLVAPSLGSVIGEGRIEFDESFKLPVTLLRDMSVRGGDADVFQKNCLEFNLYEPRRDKTVKGQLLATAIVDLADYGILKEALSISTPMNCKRSYRNTDQPLLFIKIQPVVEKNRTNSSLKDSFSKEDLKNNNGGDSVSALMNEEYAEEAEIASFTDDDVSSHSSAAAGSTSLESSGFTPAALEKNDKEHPLATETRLENINAVQQDTFKKLESSSYMSSMDVSSAVRSKVNSHASLSKSPNHNSLSTETNVASPSADSSSSSPVFDNLDVNSRGRTRSSDHENLYEKVTSTRNIVADVQRDSNQSTFSIYSRHKSSQDNSHFIGKDLGSVNCDTSKCHDKLNGRYNEEEKYSVKEGGGDKIYYGSVEDIHGNEKSNLDRQNCSEDEQSVAQGAKDQVLLGSTTYSFGGSNNGMQGNILKSERLKDMKSLRTPADSARNTGLLGSNHHAEVDQNGIPGDAQNSGGTIRSNDKRDAKIYPKEARNANLDGKIEHLEKKIKMLEGELREAAAIEAALYSVVAEHGNSMSKVHAPARRLSRLYLHACKENLPGRRSGAAKSSVSGLVLVTKACGNDVPRLTFWLSNTVMLRTIISRTTKNLVPSNPAGSSRRRKTEGEGHAKISSSQRWNRSYHGKNENTALGYECFGNWDDPHVFSSALEMVEAWIFSRIVESIWWQTLTPHMQPVDTKLNNKEVGYASRKTYRRIYSSCDQEQGNLSLVIWKNAFREACERLCPIRAGGHECGCLPMLPRLIMEQCVARLDVAMFNAILRESADEIPTDPVSDPISDPKVVPIPPGKSSFGAGAQLKTVIGNWSRWLTDLFGMDEDDSLGDKDDLKNNDERQNTSFKSFRLLNALSDLLMLPKDMLLNASIRNEVCPMFNASLIKKILDNFVPDEFCPDPVPAVVFEALDSENDMEDGKKSVNNFPCIAASIVYSPPPAISIASIVGEMGSKSQLRRSRSSVVRKSYTSDDELDELKSPLSSIFFSGSPSSAVSTKPSLKSKEIRNDSPVRYELLRNVWMNSE